MATKNKANGETKKKRTRKTKEYHERVQEAADLLQAVLDRTETYVPSEAHAKAVETWRGKSVPTAMAAIAKLVEETQKIPFKEFTRRQADAPAFEVKVGDKVHFRNSEEDVTIVKIDTKGRGTVYHVKFNNGLTIPCNKTNLAPL